jgi:hypothetical protein
VHLSPLRRSNLRAHLLRDGCCDLTLQLQDIAAIAIVGLGPNVLVGGRPKQLGGHAYSLAGANHRSLNDGVDIQFAGDCRQALPGPLVLHDGCPRDNAQRADLSQVGNQLVGHAVGEIVL